MNDGLFLNTRLLREHVSEIKEERKTVLRLRESVNMIRNLSDPVMHAQINRILSDIDKERVYFEKMADAFEDIEYNALQCSRKISTLIASDTEYAETIVDDTFFL